MRRDKLLNHMKTKLLILSVLLCTGMISCEKEVDSLDTSEAGSELNSKSSSIQKVNGVLIFPDNTYVINMIASLDEAIVQSANHFHSTYGHLTETAIEDLIDSIGYNENKPLTDFETSFAFYSLQREVKAQEISWLHNTNGEEINDDPDNHFIVDEVVRTLLNVYCEIGIGTSLYKFVKNGYYEVTDGNFTTLQSLRSNPIDISGKPNVVFYADGEMKNGCHSGKSNFGYKKNSSEDRRIKWVIAHSTYPWGVRNAIAKTKNYKKNNNKWKKYKTYCAARAYGQVSESAGDCSSAFTFNTSNGGYVSHNNKKKAKHKVSVSTKTKTGWVKGYHKGAGGIEYTSTLNF